MAPGFGIVALGLLALDLVLHLAVPKTQAWTKCLLMPLLMAFHLLESDPANPWILAALAAAAAGDALLLRFDRPAWFLGGLSAFLLGHLAWMAALLTSADFLAGVPPWYVLAVLPCGVLPLLFLRWMGPCLEAFRGGLLAYGGILLLMAVLALARIFSFRGPAAWLPFAGSLLFLLSDSLLAIHRFRGRLRWGDGVIMTTYVTAQAFLVVGLLPALATP